MEGTTVGYAAVHAGDTRDLGFVDEEPSRLLVSCRSEWKEPPGDLTW
jgi:hypothetical protein